MNFDAAAMLAGLYAEPVADNRIAEPTAAVAMLAPEPVELDDAANEWHWRHLRDADRDYLLGPRDWPDPCPWCGGRLVHSAACDELRRQWVPVMPFGKHRGRRVDELPTDYLDWLLAREVGSRAFREELRKWRTGELTGPFAQ